MTQNLYNNIKSIFVIFIIFACFILTANISAQSVKKDTIYHTLFDTNKISNSYIFDKNSDTIGLQNFIWSDRRNLSEILNDRTGYFINYLGVGGRNPINFNNFDEKHIGIFRDGIQINDNFFGGFDEENISVSEIQKIEEISNISSFLYGINSSGKALNIITKDAFQPTLFSQLRYSQDRYGAMFADFSINIPFSKKFNFIFGINSHFYDGYYQNSDFNVWRGRMKLNFYSSPKLNIKMSFYHTKINRRLNGGLVISTNDTLRNANFADVISLGSYERFSNYFFDITANANLLNDKNSLSKLIFYTNNSSRILRNGENGIDPGIFIHNDYHYIQYGLDFKQYINKKFSDLITTNLMFGGNLYYNLFNYSIPITTINGKENIPILYKKDFYSLKSKFDVNIQNTLLSGSFKTDIVDNKFFKFYGLEGRTKILNGKDINLLIKWGYSSTVFGFTYSYYSDANNNINNIKNYIYNSDRINYYQIGFEVNYKNIFLDAYQYSWKNNSIEESAFKFTNGNYNLKFLSKYIDFLFNANYSQETYQPTFFIKSDILYHNYFFNNKLDLKVGISTKYFTNTKIKFFDVEEYNFLNFIDSVQHITYEKDFFNVDFYIGARIGTANVNFTIANIFDNLNYTTAIYPYDARGGFLNTVARFSIVWDFNR